MVGNIGGKSNTIQKWFSDSIFSAFGSFSLTSKVASFGPVNLMHRAHLSKLVY
ncbi:hypothetical protein Hanom_Chr12g01083521 [Helianthus anomalus]